MEPDTTATISGIGTAVSVGPGEHAFVSFVVVATGGAAGGKITPEIEIESPLGERRSLAFPGKVVAGRNKIVDWTITIEMEVPAEGIYRARAYLNNMQRSELAFRVEVRNPFQT